MGWLNLFSSTSVNGSSQIVEYIYNHVLLFKHRRKWLLFYVIIHLGHSTEGNHQIHVHQTLSGGDFNLIYAHPPLEARTIRDFGV